MSKLSPLNVIFWSGKDVGTTNTRFSDVIDEMLEYCWNVDFRKMFNYSCGQMCDLIILGEIYPLEKNKKGEEKDLPGFEKFKGLIHREKDVGNRFRGKLVNLGGEKMTIGEDYTAQEHFLVAYNTRTVAKVELNLLPILSSYIQKGLLEINVRTIKSIEWAHKIIALHYENHEKQRAAIDYTWQQFKIESKKKDRSPPENHGKLPLLVIGDANTTEESVKKADPANGNALVIPSMVEEIVFKNPGKGNRRKSGYPTSGAPIDRAWFNSDVIKAEGVYLVGSVRQYNFSPGIHQDLKDPNRDPDKPAHLSIGVSDHPAMAVVLKAH